MRKILVGTDGTEGGRPALLAAAALATARNAELLVLELSPVLDARWVFDPAGTPAPGDPLPPLRRTFPGVLIRRSRVRGNPLRALCQMATAERPDMIVVPHGRSAGDSLLSRRASMSLVARAPCPVLLVAS